MAVRRRSGVVGIVAVLVLGVGVALTPPAVGAAPDPHGTVTLAKGASGFAAPVTTDALVDGGVLVGSQNGLFLVPQPTGKPVRVARYDRYADSGGNYVWLYTMTGVEWRNVHHPAQSGIVPDKWAFAYPGGGLYIAGPSSARRLDEQTYAQAGTTHHTTVADLPSYVTPGDVMEVGPNGVIISSFDLVNHVEHVNYVDFASGTVQELALPANTEPECFAVSSDAVGCETKHDVVRLSLTGGAPVETAATHIGAIGVTDSQTAWTTVSGTVNSVPAAGGAITTLPGFRSSDTVISLAADAARFYLARRGTALGKAGVYSLTDAGASPHRIYRAAPRPLMASGVGLSAGRVAWQDDSTTRYPVRTRTWTMHGSTIAVGPAHPLGSARAAGPAAPSLSGTRTAWAVRAGAEERLRISNGTRATTLPNLIEGSPTLSGLHVLYQQTNGDLIVRHLTDGSSVDLSTQSGAAAAALWGNYVAYVRTDGSVWRRNLHTGADSRLAPALGGGQVFDDATVWTSGDWVAWFIDSHQGSNSTVTEAYRNARTMSAPVAVSHDLVAATPDGYVIQLRQYFYVLHTWTGTAKIKFPHSLAVPSAYASVMAWTGLKGQPRIAPLPEHFADRPRALGDAHASGSVAHGSTWRFDLVTDAPLRSCAVKIVKGGATVQSLPCRTKQMTSGEAVASWHVGAHSPSAGHYRWKLVAGNQDGSLRNADGSATATTGRLRIT